MVEQVEAQFFDASILLFFHGVIPFLDGSTDSPHGPTGIFGGSVRHGEHPSTGASRPCGGLYHTSAETSHRSSLTWLVEGLVEAVSCWKIMGSWDINLIRRKKHCAMANSEVGKSWSLMRQAKFMPPVG